MTSLFDLLDQPLLTRVGWTLVHSVWQGAAVAALLGIVLLALRRGSASMRYLSACCALSLMICAMVVTFAVLPQPLRRATSPADRAEYLGNIAPIAGVPSQIISDIQRLTLQERAQRALPWLAAAWVIGVVTLSMRHLGGWLHLRRLRRENQPLADDPWPKLLAHMTERLQVRRTVKLAQSMLVEMPSVIGWLKPIILVPVSAIAGLSPLKLESILAHELAHVRRNDYLVNLVQTLVETLLFYHPAAWWIGSIIRRERENCCDDLAAQLCGDARLYAGALVKLEEIRGVPTRLALTANGAALLPRIRRLLQAPAPKARRRSWSLAAAVILLACIAAPIVTVQLQARAQDSQRHNPTTRPAIASTAQSDPFPSPRSADADRPDPATLALLQKKLPEVRFDAVALSDVIDFLRDVTSANIFVNWKSLEDAGIDKNAAVSIRLRDITFGKALELMLQSIRPDGSLRFDVEENVIKIVATPAIKAAAGARVENALEEGDSNPSAIDTITLELQTRQHELTPIRLQRNSALRDLEKAKT